MWLYFTTNAAQLQCFFADFFILQLFRLTARAISAIIEPGGRASASLLYILKEEKMQIKAEVMDRGAMSRALMRMAHQIVERNNGTEDVCLVGILRRGVPLSRMIADNIEKIDGVRVPVGYLDVTFYRDDLSRVGDMPRVGEGSIDFDVTGKKIVLVDDVIYTGRTARAAIEAIFSCGRPAEIQLAALIDRGHRELPIRPDFVGKNIPTSRGEVISVMTDEIDGDMRVCIRE